MKRLKTPDKTPVPVVTVASPTNFKSAHYFYTFKLVWRASESVKGPLTTKIQVREPVLANKLVTASVTLFTSAAQSRTIVKNIRHRCRDCHDCQKVP